MPATAKTPCRRLSPALAIATLVAALGLVAWEEAPVELVGSWTKKHDASSPETARSRITFYEDGRFNSRDVRVIDGVTKDLRMTGRWQRLEPGKIEMQILSPPAYAVQKQVRVTRNGDDLNLGFPTGHISYTKVP